MKRLSLLLGGMLMTTGLSMARAETGDLTYTSGFDGGGQMRLENTRWEFEVLVGQSRALGNKDISILADNSAFLVSDPGSPGEDEFAENGLPSPDFTGKTLIQGKRDKSWVVGAHLFYKVHPWFALGYETSYAVKDDLSIIAGGPFTVPIYTTHYKIHGFQQVLAARIGGWIGGIRPYIMAGVGPYMLSQTVDSELVDVDDPDHPPVTAADRSDWYASSVYGAGLDIKFFDEGSIGVAVQIQEVYKPGNDLRTLLPTARFAYHF